MLLIELIDYGLGGLDDIHTAWRVRVTAYGDRVVVDRQVDVAAVNGRDGFGCELLGDVLFDVFEFPGSGNYDAVSRGGLTIIRQ